MKYIIELEKIEGTDLYRAKGANTLVFDEKSINNILEPLPESEVDWSRVPVDTPIFVRAFGEDDKWERRHFAKYENGKIYAWDNGTTSFTARGIICDWEYAMLVEAQ